MTVKGCMRGRHRQGAHDDAELARVLAGSPGQVLVRSGPVHLATRRDNPLGLITTELTVGGVRADWVLDTGANQSVISRTLATQMHLTMLLGVAHTAGGVTGLENPLQVALLPELPMGDGAVVHHVPVLVLDDASLTFHIGNEPPYRIAGILGFPILRALGCVRFDHKGRLYAETTCGAAEGSPMEFRMLNPVVPATFQGQPLAFTLDTGAASTTLSVQFYRRFQGERRAWEAARTINGGAGGQTSLRSFLVPSQYSR